MMLRLLFAVGGLIFLLAPDAASAWGFQGHRVTGSIADELLRDSNAAKQVKDILNEGDPDGKLTLRLVGPWADCARSVTRKPDGTFEYSVNPDHLEYEVPCTPFKSQPERARLVDYATRNWSTCEDPPPSGCHTAYHFDDVAIQRDRYDRSAQGTNANDLVSVIGAAIAALRGRPVPPPFSIKDKKEALMLLVHFVGDLHQPLHVGVIYLDADGKLVDPDVAHAIDKATETLGGNAIQDQNVNLHGMWDDIPFDLGDARTRELMTAARAVPPSVGTIDDWPVNWASDSIQIARQAFAGLRFQRTDPPPKVKWSVSFEDHTAYLLMADIIKRRQLAKGGAHLAEILKTIWP
jgi:S1/P1 Nuclease